MTIPSDGRADYIRVHALDGSVEVWRNLPVDTGDNINWVPYGHKIASGVGYAGANIRFAYLKHPRTGRADVSTFIPVSISTQYTRPTHPSFSDVLRCSLSVIYYDITNTEHNQCCILRCELLDFEKVLLVHHLKPIATPAVRQGVCSLTF